MHVAMASQEAENGGEEAVTSMRTLCQQAANLRTGTCTGEMYFFCEPSERQGLRSLHVRLAQRARKRNLLKLDLPLAPCSLPQGDALCLATRRAASAAN